MDKAQLKRLINVAAGREPADLLITNGKIVDVYSGEIIEGKDVAVVDGVIAGVGAYIGLHAGEKTQIADARGAFIAPGLIESHIHIESSYVTPEEIGRLLVPRGTTTIVADPHEIVNVAGLSGLEYMIEAAKRTALDIKYMMPSCVPATPFEDSGAVIEAEDMRGFVSARKTYGLGEFMNFPGVVAGDDAVLDKLMLAKSQGIIVDGHSPGLLGNDLNAYAAAGIRNDHECATVSDARERIARGMYVMLREGSACHDLLNLLPAVNVHNSRRFVLCSDDRQPKTLLEKGHLNAHLAMCVAHGIDPVTAICMATLNAAECFEFKDRGAIAPGLRADLVLFEDLVDFKAQAVYIGGKLVAQDGGYLPAVERYDTSALKGRFNVKNFSEARLQLHLNARNTARVNVIELVPGGVVTKRTEVEIAVDEAGDFVYDPDRDIVKIAVVERHHGTGKMAVGLLKGYGIKHGAIALSIAHDSHNIIVVGTSNSDMSAAVTALIEQGGGIVLTRDGAVIDQMPFVVGGIMTDQSGEWVSESLTRIHQTAFEQLEISGGVEPVMTLCFMSLSVIPELKITASGLFDVTKFGFIDLEV